MDEQPLSNLLESIRYQLVRIANALEVMAIANTPRAPNYVRPITEFQTFDWSSIGAEVIKVDDCGVAQVQWGGYIWTRRSPQNKFAAAIWFSRPEGKGEDGKTKYTCLIRFHLSSEIEPIPPKVMGIVGKPVIDALPPISQISSPNKAYDETQPQTINLDAQIGKLSQLSEASKLVTKSNGSTIFWKVVRHFNIDKEKASAIAKDWSSDWAKALKMLDKPDEI